MSWRDRLGKLWPRRTVVPVVELRGVIGERPGRKGLTLERVDKQLTKAFSTKGAQAVVLLINSPGGSPVQSDLIAQRIRTLAGKHEREVLVFCEDVAASGGYWLALAGDVIYASPMSVIGSIGVVSAGFGYTGLLEKLGMERRVYTQGAHKVRLDPFSPEKSEDIDHLHALQYRLHSHFIETVKQRRGVKLSGDADIIFSGDFWTGDEALGMGLVDGLEDRDSVLKARFGESFKMVRVREKRSALSQILAMSSHSRESCDGALSPDAVLATLEERWWWQRLGL